MAGAAQRRLLIALKSPQMAVDVRPRCEDCGAVLTLEDFKAYWDGDDPHRDGCIPKGASTTPRCCVRCAETP